MGGLCQADALNLIVKKQLNLDEAIPCILRCSCGPETFDSVWKFCLHKDKHRQSTDAFICPICTEVQWSPHSFVNHPCIDPFLKTHFSSQGKVDGGLPCLSDQERDTILTCAFCENKKVFTHMSLLISHIMSSKACTEKMSRKCKYNVNYT